jgi:hypothetical protein
MRAPPIGRTLLESAPPVTPGGSALHRQQLRPEFFRGHGENASFVQQLIKGGSNDPGASSSPASSSAGGAGLTSAAAVAVYRDNVRLSGVDDLRQMQLSTIREIRCLPGPDAVIRFGTNTSAGAILVTSKSH